MDGETGQLVWFESYSTLQNERVVAAACDQDGNLYVIGRAAGEDSIYDLIVQRYQAASGDLYWTEYIASPGGLDDIGWDITVDGQGRPVVCGLVGTSPSEASIVTVVLDPDFGQEVWRRDLPGGVYNIETIAGWVATADNDDVILATRTWSTTTGYDVVMRRYAAADGDDVWSQRWNSGGTTADDPRAMMLDGAGDVLVAGVSDSDYLVAKFAGDTGAFVWQGSYAGPPDWYDVAACLDVAPDGTIVATGFSDGTGTGWDVATVGFAPDDGSQEWALRFDGYSLSDEARDLAVGPTGNIAVVGYAYSFDAGNDALTVIYAADDATAVPAGETPAIATIVSAYPNPFNPRVTLAFDLPQDATADLAVFDLRGRRVADLVAGPHRAGRHAVVWDGVDAGGRSLPSGQYLAVLRAGKTTNAFKLMLAE